MDNQKLNQPEPTVYSYEEAYSKSLVYFEGDELAAKVWLDKYAAKNKDSQLLEDVPSAMHLRMAKKFSEASLNWIGLGYQDKPLSEYGKNLFLSLTNSSLENLNIFFYNCFEGFKTINPQGRVMAGLGIDESYRSLSNCLRLPPPKDSYSSILYSDTMLVSAAKRGCGYGIGISNLRPQEAYVKNSSNSSTGPVSFMHRFSFSTREVAQNGRRGACLIDMDSRHPNISQFIQVKNDRTSVTGANISVKYVDEFLFAVDKNEDFLLRYPIDMDISSFKKDNLEKEKLLKVGDNQFVLLTNARNIFNLMVKCASEFAEPGVLFISRIENYDPASVYKKYKIDGPNACGEQPMAVGDTCRLIALNLFSFILNPFTKMARLDESRLYSEAYKQLICGDILVDLEIEYIDRIISKINSDPEPKEEKAIELALWTLVREMAESGRRIGCGITALGDAIAASGFKYGSPESIKLSKKIMKIKMTAELDASTDLAIIRGSFKEFDSNLEFPEGKEGGNDFYKMLLSEFPQQVDRIKKFGRRNVNWSTIAPCGTLSIMTQSTSGCEPLFMPFYTRRVKINPSDRNHKVSFIDKNGDSWREQIVIHPKIKKFLLNSEEAPKETIESHFKNSSYYKATANDIHWSDRIKIQGILQDYTSSAISSTINLPKNTKESEVYDIYLSSWKRGLKGQTIYRDGCRDGVLISNEDKKECKVLPKTTAPKRPESLNGEIYTLTYKGKNLYVAVGLWEDGSLYEIFTGVNLRKKIEHHTGKIVKKSRGKYFFIAPDGEEYHLTNGNNDDNADALARTISWGLRHGAGIEFAVHQLEKTEGDLLSFSKVIARVLKKYIKNGTQVHGEHCPQCKSQLVRENGCKTCKSCGYSACG